MIRIITLYGSIAGVIVVAPMLAHWLSLGPGDDPFADGVLLGYLTMVVALTAVFLGIKRYRDRVLGGAIRFLPAFGVGVAISAVASVFYVVGWEMVMALSDFDFAAWYSDQLIEQARPKGAQALEQALADVEQFKRLYANPLTRMSFTFIEIFPVGVAISLISAAVLRNSRVLPARAPV
jgi:hypothetical protein